jgi:hypothetical protein
MPKQRQPITERPKVEDESTGNGSEFHGKHREGDEALPGRGSTKGGMNRDSSDGTRGGMQNEGRSEGNSNKPSGQTTRR